MFQINQRTISDWMLSSRSRRSSSQQCYVIMLIFVWDQLGLRVLGYLKYITLLLIMWEKLKWKTKRRNCWRSYSSSSSSFFCCSRQASEQSSRATLEIIREWFTSCFTGFSQLRIHLSLCLASNNCKTRGPVDDKRDGILDMLKHGDHGMFSALLGASAPTPRSAVTPSQTSQPSPPPTTMSSICKYSQSSSTFRKEPKCHPISYLTIVMAMTMTPW